MLTICCALTDVKKTKVKKTVYHLITAGKYIVLILIDKTKGVAIFQKMLHLPFANLKQQTFLIG
jgi:hypothetical protein